MELFARQLAAVGVVTSLLALMSPSAEARNPHSSPPLPDLALSALTLSPSTAAAGATVVAKTTVTNQGTAASPATTVTYWVTPNLSTSPSSPGAVALASVSVQKLPAGAGAQLVVSLPIPATVSAGAYYVQAMVDSASLVGETNEANNLASAPLTVSAPASSPSSAGPFYYVSPAGSDSNDGSAKAPWRTIQQAASRATPGAVINVAPGDYHEAVTSQASGTAAARISFVSTTPWGARVTSTGVWSTWLNLASYVDIVGFDVTGDGNIGIQNEGSFVRILGNRVHDIPGPTCADGNGGSGINNSNYSASDSDIIGNLVFRVGSLSATCNRVHGIYHSNLRGHIENNIVFAAQGCGIHTWHAPYDLVIANNLSFGNGVCGIVIGAGDSPGGVTADWFTVVNNIVINNGQLGIYESGQTGTNNRYLNNLVHGNAVNISLQNGNVALNTIVADPAFVNFQPDGTGDYHLSATSPAADHGSSVGAPVEDFDGLPRPQGVAWDIGPYERQ